MPPEPGARSFAAAGAAEVLRRLGAQVFVRGWLSANNVLFAAGARAGATVVDTGYASHADLTLALLARALDGQPLAGVINTHLHSDHCGGNAGLQRRWPGLSLRVPEGYRDRLCPWDEQRLSYRDTDQACEPFAPTGFIAAGQTVTLGPHEWEVHAAPGHDPDAVMLFEPVYRVLISGDALWEKRLAIVFPELSGESAFDVTEGTLNSIERLRPALVLPGHGDPFFDAGAAIAASRQRLLSFARDPERHRLYAARALVTYHLLEHRKRGYDELVRWMTRTPIFQRALRCADDPELAHMKARDVLDRLIADGVVTARGGLLMMAGEQRAD